jgi:class 3 adenylate cyclase
VSRACPSCGSDNDTSARFCAACGTSLPQVCPRCGAGVPDAARFCATCGQSLAAEVAPDERKIATVVFIDLVDSTALGDRLDPERVRAILQGYFSVVSSTVAAWGGSIEKYIGDAAVAVFGVPRVREDDAARAVSAAVEINERIAALAAELDERSDVRLAIRIGVNTGEVIAPAEIHPDRPMVTGDTVNVAARIEAAARPGEILVGERTYQAARSIFAFEPAEPVMAKGKPEPVAVQRLVGRASGAEAGPARAVRGPLVGRQRELTFIAGQLDEAIASGRPRLALVYGEAGIGKSRLVREAVAMAGSERADLTVYRGRCPAVDKGITYWPLVEILRAACGISLDDDAAMAGAKLDQRIAELLVGGASPDLDAAATTFALATTAGIPIPDNPLDDARPLAVRNELARRWPAFTSALAGRGPLVLVVEDLHWANALLVEMLERILARAVGPILVVATARPEFAQAETTLDVGKQDAATVSLRPLDAEQGSALLDALLPERRLPPETETAILATAEGNPLFVEEIVARLVETGALVQDELGWHASGDTLRLAIPDTIHGVLAARIDGLPEQERRVLREAAVIGRFFWDRPLGLAVGAPDVGEPLDALERRGLVVLRPASTLRGEVEYMFKHALVRDVAYAGLSLARRAAAHASTAIWLATLSPERPEELAELVAYHWERALGDGSDLAWEAGSAELADIRRRAMQGFRVAAETARKRYDLKRAIELQERAIELAVTPADRAATLEELGDIYDSAYDGDHARAAWDEALTIARTLPEGSRAIPRMCMNFGRMAAIMWGSFATPVDPEVIDHYVEEGLAADPDDRTRAWLEMLRAAAGIRWIAFHRPDPVPAGERIAALDAAYAWAEHADDTALQSNILHNRRALLIANGDVAGSIEAARQQLETASRVGDPRERHLGIIEAANTLMWVAGEPAPMIEPLEGSLVLGRELRAHDVNHSTTNLMAALALSGRWDEIPPVIDEHLAAFDDQPDGSCPFAMSGFPLAAIFHARRGSPDEGLALLEKKTPESEWPVGMVEALRAMARLELGDAATARDEARRVLDTGERNYAEEPAIEVLVLPNALVALEDWDGIRSSLAELRARQDLVAMGRPTLDRAEALARAADGDRAAAVQLLAAAITRFDALDPYEAARTREHLAALVDGPRRDGLLGAARATYDRLGAAPDAKRLAAVTA